MLESELVVEIRTDIGLSRLRLGLLWPETRPNKNRVWLSETQPDSKNRVCNWVGFPGLGTGLGLGLAERTHLFFFLFLLTNSNSLNYSLPSFYKPDPLSPLSTHPLRFVGFLSLLSYPSRIEKESKEEGFLVGSYDAGGGQGSFPT